MVEGPLKARRGWHTRLARDWLLIIAITGLVLSCAWAGRIPVISATEAQVLFILFVLLVTVKGLELGGLFSRLAWRMESGKAVPLKLVTTTFILSMLITNDVALFVVVPLTLMLNVDKKDILVILEAVAANAGSALTPIGNPQNLYIYWYYGIDPAQFMTAIAPLSIVFFVILALASGAIKTRNGVTAHAPAVHKPIAYGFVSLLFITILMVLHILPLYIGIAVIIGALLLKPASLLIDYGLLATFVCFFVITENLESLMAPAVAGGDRVFMLSALSSQIISNVPAALLFAKFTDQWQALLWGTNTGGFGSVVGSLANLIAYRLYINTGHAAGRGPVAIKFMLIGYTAFFIGMGLYALVGG